MKSKTKYRSRRPYIIGDNKADKLIAELAGLYSAPRKEEFLRQIITTAVKLGKDGTGTGDLKLINTSLKELRHAFRVFSPYRETKKVIVFGSARAKKTSAPYKMAERFAKEMVKRDYMVITGGGPGIMEAANKGAGIDNGFGLNIRLPYEQKPNKYVKERPHLINFKYFFTRKLIFIKESDATVLFPGGFGTHDEGFENLTLIQTGKCRPRPIILMEPAGSKYWSGWKSFTHGRLLKSGYISRDDMKLFTYARTPKEAADYIEKFYKIYHSIRYIGDLTVLRLQHPLSVGDIRFIKKEFKDILIDGYVKNSGPLTEELERDEYPYLPRLIVKFNRMYYGRLCEMIHEINRS